MFEKTSHTFNSRGTWGTAIEQMHCPGADMLH